MPSFQPSDSSPSSRRRWRPVSCASRPRSILGSRAMTARIVSGHVEVAHGDVAEADLVAVAQHGLADADAVDDHAVEAAVVEDHDIVAAAGDDGVAAGHGQVLEHHVRAGRAAHVDRVVGDLDHDDLRPVLDREVPAGIEAGSGDRGPPPLAPVGARKRVADLGGALDGGRIEERHVGSVLEKSKRSLSACQEESGGRTVVMRVLVTGARGKVGAAAVVALLDAGHDVTALDVGAPVFEAPEPGAPAYFQADLADAGDAFAAVRGHDAVIHSAAIPEPTRNPPHRVFQNNLMATFNVIEAAV